MISKSSTWFYQDPLDNSSQNTAYHCSSHKCICTRLSSIIYLTNNKVANWIGRNVGIAELMLGEWLQGRWSELLHNGHCAETWLIGLHTVIGMRLLNIWHQPTILLKAFLVFVLKIFYTLNNTPIITLNQYNNRVVKKRCQLSPWIPFT